MKNVKRGQLSRTKKIGATERRRTKYFNYITTLEQKPYCPVPIQYAVSRFTERVKYVISKTDLPTGTRKLQINYVKKAKLEFLKKHFAEYLRMEQSNGKWTCCKNRFLCTSFRNVLMYKSVPRSDILPFIQASKKTINRILTEGDPELDSEETRVRKKKNSENGAIASDNIIQMETEAYNKGLSDMKYKPVPIAYAMDNFTTKFQLVFSCNRVPRAASNKKRQQVIRTAKFRFLKKHFRSSLKIKKSQDNWTWTCCQNKFDSINPAPIIDGIKPSLLMPFVKMSKAEATRLANEANHVGDSVQTIFQKPTSVSTLDLPTNDSDLPMDEYNGHQGEIDVSNELPSPKKKRGKLKTVRRNTPPPPETSVSTLDLPTNDSDLPMDEYNGHQGEIDVSNELPSPKKKRGKLKTVRHNTPPPPETSVSTLDLPTNDSDLPMHEYNGHQGEIDVSNELPSPKKKRGKLKTVRHNTPPPPETSVSTLDLPTNDSDLPMDEYNGHQGDIDVSNELPSPKKKRVKLKTVRHNTPPPPEPCATLSPDVVNVSPLHETFVEILPIPPCNPAPVEEIWIPSDSETPSKQIKVEVLSPVKDSSKSQEVEELTIEDVFNDQPQIVDMDLPPPSANPENSSSDSESIGVSKNYRRQRLILPSDDDDDSPPPRPRGREVPTVLKSCHVELQRMSPPGLHESREWRAYKRIRANKPLVVEDPRKLLFGAETVRQRINSDSDSDIEFNPAAVNSSSRSSSSSESVLSNETESPSSPSTEDSPGVESEEYGASELEDEKEQRKCPPNRPIIILKTVEERRQLREERKQHKAKRIRRKKTRAEYVNTFMGHLSYAPTSIRYAVDEVTKKLKWDVFPFGAKVLGRTLGKKELESLSKSHEASEWTMLKQAFVLKHFREAFRISKDAKGELSCCKNTVDLLDCKSFLKLFWNITIN